MLTKVSYTIYIQRPFLFVIDDDEKTTKYRDVRDIFGELNTATKQPKESRLRLNRDALAASRKLGLRSTFTGTSHILEEEDPETRPRTTPSSPTSNSFARPPKSPLRLPPRYDDHHEEYQHQRFSLDTPPLDMARSLSISSVNSSASTALPKTPKNASYSSRKGKSILSEEENMILEDQELDMSELTKKKNQRRLSSPAERKRQSHTFPNRNNNASSSNANSKKRHNDILMKEEGGTPILGGSLGHKLDRQYRETANEILAKKPSDEQEDKEEKLLLLSKDGHTTTHYVSSKKQKKIVTWVKLNCYDSNWVTV